MADQQARGQPRMLRLEVGRKRRVSTRRAQKMSGEHGVLLVQEARGGKIQAVGDHVVKGGYNHVVPSPRPLAGGESTLV